MDVFSVILVFKGPVLRSADSLFMIKRWPQGEKFPGFPLIIDHFLSKKGFLIIVLHRYRVKNLIVHDIVHSRLIQSGWMLTYFWALNQI